MAGLVHNHAPVNVSTVTVAVTNSAGGGGVAVGGVPGGGGGGLPATHGTTASGGGGANNSSSTSNSSNPTVAHNTNSNSSLSNSIGAHSQSSNVVVTTMLASSSSNTAASSVTILQRGGTITMPIVVSSPTTPASVTARAASASASYHHKIVECGGNTLNSSSNNSISNSASGGIISNHHHGATTTTSSTVTSVVAAAAAAAATSSSLTSAMSTSSAGLSTVAPVAAGAATTVTRVLTASATSSAVTPTLSANSSTSRQTTNNNNNSNNNSGNNVNNNNSNNCRIPGRLIPNASAGGTATGVSGAAVSRHGSVGGTNATFSSNSNNTNCSSSSSNNNNSGGSTTISAQKQPQRPQQQQQPSSTSTTNSGDLLPNEHGSQHSGLVDGQARDHHGTLRPAGLPQQNRSVQCNEDQSSAAGDNEGLKVDTTAMVIDDEHQQQQEPEIDVVINNVVCSFSVGCHLNLRQIALTGANVEFRRESGMVSMKLRNPYTTASIWSSGKITCTGATSEFTSKMAARRYARVLQKLGFRARFKNFKIVNVLGTCTMPFAIKLVPFSQANKPIAQYEPELHPGVTYKIRDIKATLKIFSTGSITVTAPSVDAVQQSIERIYPLVFEHRKERTCPEDMPRSHSLHGVGGQKGRPSARLIRSSYGSSARGNLYAGGEENEENNDEDDSDDDEHDNADNMDTFEGGDVDGCESDQSWG